MYGVRVQEMAQTLRSLKAAGIIRTELYPGEYQRVIDTLHLLIIYWLPFCEIRQDAKGPHAFRVQAWSILYPLFTDEGRRSFESLGCEMA